MVHDQHDDVLALREPHQPRAHERRAREVERSPKLFADQTLDRALLLVGA